MNRQEIEGDSGGDKRESEHTKHAREVDNHDGAKNEQRDHLVEALVTNHYTYEGPTLSGSDIYRSDDFGFSKNDPLLESFSDVIEPTLGKLVDVVSIARYAYRRTGIGSLASISGSLIDEFESPDKFGLGGAVYDLGVSKIATSAASVIGRTILMNAPWFILTSSATATVKMTMAASGVALVMGAGGVFVAVVVAGVLAKDPIFEAIDDTFEAAEDISDRVRDVWNHRDQQIMNLYFR